MTPSQQPRRRLAVYIPRQPPQLLPAERHNLRSVLGPLVNLTGRLARRVTQSAAIYEEWAPRVPQLEPLLVYPNCSLLLTPQPL